MADDKLNLNQQQEDQSIEPVEPAPQTDAPSTSEPSSEPTPAPAPVSTPQTEESTPKQEQASPFVSADNNAPENQPTGYTTEQNNTQGTYYSYSPNQNYGQYNPQQYYQQNGFYGQNYNPPPKKKKGGKIALITVSVVAIVTVFSLLGFWAISEVSDIFSNRFGITSNSSDASKDSKNKDNDNDASLNDLVTNSKPSGSDEYSVYSDGTMTPAAVIEKVRPSIVGIVQYTNSKNGIPTISGEGSGIIISSDGYIVTNAHVVEGATMITVVLDNNEEYRATLKGIDTQTDLAVIKIDEKGLPAAELGNSAQTVLGESVIAIGNPGGMELAGSCTGGMVSGLNRTISTDSVGYAMTYIQTDAAINPGNSGGALVNMYGQVIGINSAKIVAEGYEGLGFAISINEAIPIVNDLQRYGYVKNRAKIGIGFQLITEAVSQYYNYSIPAGLLVTVIDEDCDIANKDVEINDIITKIDGDDITSANVVYSVLQNKKPGDTVKLTVYRIGTRASTSKTFDIMVVLSEDKGEN